MIGFATSAPAWRRLAAPGATSRRGPCHSALFPFAPRHLASTMRGQAGTLATQPII